MYGIETLSKLNEQREAKEAKIKADLAEESKAAKGE